MQYNDMRGYMVIARFWGIAALLCLAFITSSHNAHAIDSFKSPNQSSFFKPALVYVSGTQDNDKAFIEMARQGAERAKEELKIEYTEYRLPENESPTDFMEYVAKQGHSPIIALGQQNVVPVISLADKYPDTLFTVVDGLVPPIFQNVQSVRYKDHEGAFLVGMIAAYNSPGDHIGFIGGKNVPLIRNFGLGFQQGAQFVKPAIRIDVDMIGETDDAWSNPGAGYDIAGRMYAEGADVIFAAAGGSGLGVLRAAADKDKLAIGVDSNQNALYPGHVLTSLVKRVDNAVFQTLKAAHEKKWSAGIRQLGLRDGALDFSVDRHNNSLITKKLVEQVSTVKERIINGLIEVEMYAPN